MLLSVLAFVPQVEASRSSAFEIGFEEDPTGLAACLATVKVTGIVVWVFEKFWKMLICMGNEYNGELTSVLMPLDIEN